MARQKIKVYDKDGVEIKDEYLRKRILATRRIISKPRKPEVEAYIRRNRKRLVEEAKNQPFIKGIQWHLGPHQREDICDKLATQDLYGLGPGCYPANAYPDIPHDNCHCWDTEIVDKDYFKNYSPSEEEMAAIKKDPKYPEFKKWAEDWLARRHPEDRKDRKTSFVGKFFNKLFR